MLDGGSIGGLLGNLNSITKRDLIHTSASAGEAITITRMESPNIHWHRPHACHTCALNVGMTKYAPTPNYKLFGHLLANFIPMVDQSWTCGGRRWYFGVVNHADAAAGNFSYPAHGRSRWRLNDLLADKGIHGRREMDKFLSPIFVISVGNLMKMGPTGRLLVARSGGG
jgi:hypothetical protein